jgi:transposase-like protein
MRYLYFLGLSYRNTAKALSFLLLVKISHFLIWKWMQKYKPKKISDKKKKIKEYYCIQKDETEIKICSGLMLF